VPPTGASEAVDYFAALGLPKRYDLAETEIATAYRAKARETHPDRFAGGDAETIAAATRHSASVNDAYRTLIDPVARANYLLLACGGPGSDEVRDVPGNLLVEVMAWREEIDAANASGDAGALARHREAIGHKRGDALAAVADAAGMLDRAGDDDKRAMRIELNAIKYYDNLLEQLATDPLAGHETQTHG